VTTSRLKLVATALVFGLATAIPSVDAAETSSQKVCSTCGTVKHIQVIEEKGKGSGLGAVAGGVAGGLIGSQIGSGTGNTVATVAGVAGGAYAGHQVEKKVKTKKTYKITVQMNTGKTRVFTQEEEPAVHVGDKVKLVDGKIVPR